MSLSAKLHSIVKTMSHSHWPSRLASHPASASELPDLLLRWVLAEPERGQFRSELTMLDMPLYIAAGTGALLIILGFVALMSQRIYMDPHTQSPIEIDLPMLGKMKANYPALIFVLLGCFLTINGLRLDRAPKKIPWYVSGTIVADAQRVKWGEGGHLKVFPAEFDMDIDPSGKFTIKLELDEGKTFEQAIERVDYSDNNGNIQFSPKEEFEKYEKNQPSKLIGRTDTTRTYEAHLKLLPPPHN